MSWLEKYKKILIILGFVLLVFILGYLLYLMFFKPSLPTDVGQTATTTTTGGLPSAGQGTGNIIGSTGQNVGGLPTQTQETQTQASDVARGGLTQTTGLNQTPSLAATISSNGNDLQYYNKSDGKFYRISKDGKITALSDQVFYDVENITWSPNKNKAILEYPDGANIIYNFETNKQVSLPAHWKNFDFSSDGSKIVFKSMANDTNNRWLAITNDQGTDTKTIAALGDKDETVYPSWSPNNQTVAMYTEGQNFDQQSVYFVGLNDENFKSLTIDGRGFEFEWSPQGNNLLYSVYSSSSDLKPELWVASAQGESIGAARVKLNIQTWADKCVFSSNTTLYCAVPESLEEGAGLFPDLAGNTKDNLYQIDTQTGLKKLIAKPASDTTMTNLIVSDNGYYLYYTDASTGTINQIKLK